jgi:hypothetical protein
MFPPNAICAYFESVNDANLPTPTQNAPYISARSRSSLFKSLFETIPGFRQQTSRSVSEGLIEPRSPGGPRTSKLDTPINALNNPPLSPRVPLSPRASSSQRSSLEATPPSPNHWEDRLTPNFQLNPPPRRPVRSGTTDGLGLGLRRGRSPSSARANER